MAGGDVGIGWQVLPDVMVQETTCNAISPYVSTFGCAIGIAPCQWDRGDPSTGIG